MEKTDIAKYTIKDSLFTNLFQDKKYLLQLYRALHPEDTETTEDELKDITIKNILVDSCYNDLGFTVGDKIMILTEAQTTWTMNIIIRALMYLVQSYHEYFEHRNDNLYGSKKVKLPKPELYVIFTGKRISKPEYISLSEEFFSGEECAIDVKVKMIYDGKDNDIISQYVAFTKVYDEQVKLYGRTRKAVTNTINICKNRDVLKEYLSSREQEVVDMMMTLFDEEQVMRAYVESEKKEAAEKAAAEAAKKAAVISAIEMCQEIGLPVSETIKKIAGKYKLEENDAEAWVQKYWK
ncbi:hypothetical protein V1226_12040 [Lachnospiraceae bacterium JLR.KK009]|nr:hypothetical protein C810_02204 [Lachnospiraceae bacterium A2]